MPIPRRGAQARRLPHRRVRLPSGQVDRRFEYLVERALDRLPEDAQPLLQNVAIVIEDEPTAEQRLANKLRGDDTLYGLYEGTPAVEYGAGWAPFPNKITLFRVPLEEDFPDPWELEAEVRRTVLHELAHHAGIEEERLESYGLD